MKLMTLRDFLDECDGTDRINAFEKVQRNAIEWAAWWVNNEPDEIVGSDLINDYLTAIGKEKSDV